MYFRIQIHTPSRDTSVVKVKDVVLTCKEIKLPSFLLILPSSSPIPHSLLLPLTRPLSFSHPLASLPYPPLCFTHSLLISSSGLSHMLNFSCPLYLKCRIFNFNLALTIFIQISENIPCVFCHSSKDRVFFS